MRIVIALTALALAGAAPTAFAAVDARYALANDCWTLTSASAPVSDGPFFLKPSDLGSYLFYDKNKAFLSGSNGLGIAYPGRGRLFLQRRAAVGWFRRLGRATRRTLRRLRPRRSLP